MKITMNDVLESIWQQNTVAYLKKQIYNFYLDVMQ